MPVGVLRGGLMLVVLYAICDSLYEEFKAGC
jgi:hypothetical protein